MCKCADAYSQACPALRGGTHGADVQMLTAKRNAWCKYANAYSQACPDYLAIFNAA